MRSCLSVIQKSLREMQKWNNRKLGGKMIKATLIMIQQVIKL